MVHHRIPIKRRINERFYQQYIHTEKIEQVTAVKADISIEPPVFWFNNRQRSNIKVREDPFQHNYIWISAAPYDF